MKAKSNDGPKIYITSKGAQSVNAKELFNRPRVRKFINGMIEIEKNSKTNQKSSDSIENSK